MAADHLLALDAGTQSMRALLFDAAGTLVARARVPYPAALSREPGWAERPAEQFWEALVACCRTLWRETTVPPSAVAGVALTTQRGSVVPLDAQGRPLRPVILWQDQRQTAGLSGLGFPWGWIFKAIRMEETIAYFQANTEALWIARHEPEIWERTARYLLLSGYLSHCLTGEYTDSIGAQVGYIPFDYKKLRWAGRRDWKWQVVPLQETMLPTLVPPTEALGTIQPSAAAATGIPAGVPLVAAGADKACELLGSGAIDSETACLSYGTAATINVLQRRYVEVIPFLPPYPAVIPGAYNNEIQISRGYWMVEWFKAQFGQPERRRADAEGVTAESLFDDLISAVPPGSLGLILQPYWLPGIREPGPEAKGAVVGFGDAHGRAHLYRAIIEGVAYGLREGKERIERRTKSRVSELRVAGGGSQSDAALQITADIFGLPATRPHVYEASGLGAAIAAAVGTGLHPDVRSAVAAMTRPGARFEPDAARHALYDRLYNEVYLHIYERLQPLYHAIQDITGYPRRPM